MGSIQNQVLLWLTKAVLNKSTIVFEGKLENILAKFGDLYQLYQLCYVSSLELRELHELGA